MPVLGHLILISAWLVKGPALCPGAGAAERPQEKVYLFFHGYAIGKQIDPLNRIQYTSISGNHFYT